MSYDDDDDTSGDIDDGVRDSEDLKALTDVWFGYTASVVTERFTQEAWDESLEGDADLLNYGPFAQLDQLISSPHVGTKGWDEWRGGRDDFITGKPGKLKSKAGGVILRSLNIRRNDGRPLSYKEKAFIKASLGLHKRR